MPLSVTVSQPEVDDLADNADPGGAAMVDEPDVPDELEGALNEVELHDTDAELDRSDVTSAAFEVESHGVELCSPMLLDLLSDVALDGGIGCGTTAVQAMPEEKGATPDFDFENMDF